MDDYGFGGLSIDDLPTMFSEAYSEEYNAIWEEAADGETTVPGDQCACVFKKSGLAVSELAQIWERVDPENTGYLDRKRFIVALGIVALVQDGHQPVPGILEKLEEQTSLAPPAMDGASETTKSKQPRTPMTPQGPGYTIRVEIGEAVGSLRKHTEYVVITEPVSWNVTRRYKDFEWLSASLEKTFPYTVVPRLPEKSFGQRFEEKFLKERCRQLEFFLITVVSHPVLGHCEVTKAFLRDDEKTFKGRDATVFDGTEKFDADSDAAKFPPPDDADSSLAAIRTWADAFERNCAALLKVNEKIITSQESIAADLLDLGRFSETLLTGENSTGKCWLPSCSPCAQSHDGLTRMRQGCEDCAQIFISHAMHQRSSYSDNLRSCVYFVRSMREIYKRRDNHMKATQSHVKKLNSSKEKLSQLKLKGGKPDKVQKMEKQISEEEERLNVMQKLQNFITNTLLTETQRFHEFKVYSTADMLDSYSSDFMGFANELLPMWKATNEDVNKMPRGL